MKIAVFDFETTGKEVQTDRVTQLAVALYDTDTKRLIGSYSETLYSEEYPPIHPDAAEVTGISDDYLKRVGSLPYESFIVLINYFNRADRVVGHNIRQFDLPILYAEMGRLHLPIEPIKGAIDSRFDIEYPKTIATRKLSYLAVEHGIPVTHSHSALFDVITNAELFFKYELDKILELAASPEIWVRADVNFDKKQLAKDRKYLWDGPQKIWAKQIKEMHFNREVEECAFPVLKLGSDYQFPESK